MLREPVVAATLAARRASDDRAPVHWAAVARCYESLWARGRTHAPAAVAA
jgi:hypothetical protein